MPSLIHDTDKCRLWTSEGLNTTQKEYLRALFELKKAELEQLDAEILSAEKSQQSNEGNAAMRLARRLLARRLRVSDLDF